MCRLWALGIVALTLAGTSAAAEIGFLEDFALAPDRQRAIDQLIPGSDEYYYYRCLHLQALQQYDQVDRLLPTWIEQHRVTERVREIQHRQSLLTYERHPRQSLDYVQRELGLQFNHQRETVDRAAELPTALDPQLVSRERLRQEAWNRHPDTLNGCEDAALEWLATQELDPARRRDLLQRLARPDLSGLPALVAADLEAPNSPGFGAFGIHRVLLPAQLDKLLELRPGLRDEGNFVSVYLTKLRPNPDVDWRHSPAEREAYLERLWGFASTLSPAHNSLKAHVLYHWLVALRARGVYDERKFREYLALPRPQGYVNPRYLETAEHRRFPCNLGEDFSATTLFPPVGDDEPLVRSYLQHFFVEADNYAAYAQFVEDGYLKRLFAETKIVHGLGDPQRWYAMLPPEQYQALKERVDIDFAPENPEHFAAAAPVALGLHVKNVPTLIVKVYRINALNYYRDQAAEIHTGLNLDGLVANEELTFRYDEPPLRRVARRFEFPQLAQPGVYVIDFIGGGKSSRALIHKGRLHHVVQTTVAGHAFTVFNEAREQVADAALWMGGRRYEADEQGVILVPYSTSPGPQPIVLLHGELATLATFAHQAESYRLHAAAYVDREALIGGRLAQALVRAGLTLNGEPVTRSILQNVRLDVTSVDLDGVSSTATVADVKLTDDADLLHEFRVPPRLASLALTLRAQVNSVSENRLIDLESSTTFAVNESEKTSALDDLHLSREGADYQLELLGRSGEARANRPVTVTLKHAEFRDPVQAALRTDDAGRIVLGPLSSIEWVQAQGPSGVPRQWPLRRDRAAYPPALHGVAGAPLELSAADLGDEATRERLSLLEVRDGAFVADRFDALAIDDGTLRIAGLPPGDYDLLLKPSGRRIPVLVTEGPTVAGFALGAQRNLELRGAAPLHVRRVLAGEEEVTITLGHATELTRVHVFAADLQPAFDAFAQLSQVGDAAPLWSLRGPLPAIYLAGRRLGDELRYVLERKYAEKLPGNMLPRPEILLNPWAVRGTQTSREQLEAGEAFAADAPASVAAEARSQAGGEVAPPLADFASLEFFAQSSAALVNLRPDAEGRVVVPRDQLKGKRWVTVVAVDPFHTSCRETLLHEPASRRRDMRLLQPLDPARHFSQQKQIDRLAEGAEFTLDDIRSGRFELYDSLPRVYQLYETLLPNSPLGEFRFVLEWPALSDDAKREKYSKYACHELNFFLQAKDPAFFAAVVQPYLRHKLHKTFLDHYLLEDDLSAYVAPSKYRQLNTVERILLGRRVAEARAGVTRELRDAWQLVPPDIEQFNRLFDTAVRGQALSAEGTLALGDALEAAQNRPEFAAEALFDSGMGGMRGATAWSALDGRKVLSESRAAGRFDEALDEKAGADRYRADAPPAPAIAAAPSGGVARRSLARDRLQMGLEVREAERLQRLFQPLDQTQEWAENNYYQRPLGEQRADLVPLNGFWVDWAEHDPQQPFLSTRLAEASRNFTEAMFALSLLDLPAKAPAHEAEVVDSTARVKLQGAAIVFHEQIQPTRAQDEAAPILVSQNFFRQDDRYQQVGNEQIDKFVTDEFLAEVAYGCQIVVTNPTSSRRKLDVLVQIPVGAIPLANGRPTRHLALQLEPYRTEAIEYAFYFPAPGEFAQFPVHVARAETLVAAAAPRTFRVVAEPTQIDRTSWPYLSQYGSNEDVLDFLKQENLGLVDLEKIAFRMAERPFYEQTIAILRGRHKFHPTLWSYAIRHDDPAAVREYLDQAEGFVSQCGVALDSPLLTIDPVQRGVYEHLEYRPLVNARAHQVGQRRQILNDRFREQYHRWLKVLSYQRELQDQDRLNTVYYLLLQDRLTEAADQFAQVDRQRVTTHLQYDYCAAYLAMSAGRIDDARALAGPYAAHPVDRWRNAFALVGQHLAEIEGKAGLAVDERERGQAQDELAANQPSLEFVVENGGLRIDYRNLDAVQIRYYLMDIELLFSRNPFVQRFADQFGYIEPNLQQRVALGGDQKRHELTLPESLRGRNVLIEVEGAGIRRTQTYYSHQLTVQVVEPYGQVRVADAATGRPAAAAYVKTYALLKDGRVEFYKDGYTDLRGRFDYATLSTNQLDNVERFAILVLSEELGALVREAEPPRR